MEGLSQYSTLDPEADPLVGGLSPLALQDPSLFFFSGSLTTIFF